MNSRAHKRYRIESKARFRELYNFTLQYDDMRQALAEISYYKSSQLTGVPRGGGISNPTERTGVRYAALQSNINLIEQCAREADPEIYAGVLKGVTTGATYNWLTANNYLYCGRDKYYLARARYYWLLDRKKE